MNRVLNYEGHDYKDLESSKMYLDKASKSFLSHRIHQIIYIFIFLSIQVFNDHTLVSQNTFSTPALFYRLRIIVG